MTVDNELAVDTRYPGEYADPDREEAEDALRIATEIYELCRQKIGL